MLLPVMGLLTSHFLHTGERMRERYRRELPDLCLDPRVVEVIVVLKPLGLNCYCIYEQRCSKNIFFLIPLNLLNWTNLYICTVVHVFYTRHVWIHKWLCMTGGLGSLLQCWQTYPSQHTFPPQWSSKLLEKWDWKETRQSGWTMLTLLCVTRSPRPWWLWIPAFCKSVCKHVAHKHVCKLLEIFVVRVILLALIYLVWGSFIVFRSKNCYHNHFWN